MSIFDRLNEWFDDLRVPERYRRELDEAEVLLRDGDHAGAASILTGIERREPELWRVQFLLGICREAEGKLELAAGHYEEATRLRDDPIAGAALARIYAQQGRTDEARELLQAALSASRADSVRAEVLKGIANLSEAEGDWQEAAGAYQSLAQLEPTMAEWRRREAAALDAAGEIESARSVLLRASADDPRAAVHLAELTLRIDAGEPLVADAILALERLDPSSRGWEWALRVGQLENARGNAQRAKDVLAAAAADAPAQVLATVHREIANAIFQSGDVDLAREHAEAASLLEESEKLRFLQLQIAIAQKDFDRVEALAATILRENPDHEAARRMLAETYLDRDRVEDARALLATLPADEDTPELTLLHARVALLSGDPDTALSMLRRQSSSDVALDVASLIRRAMEMLAPPVPDVSNLQTSDLNWLRELIRFCQETATGHPAVQRYFQTFSLLADLIDRPVSIAVLGEFNAGKSSLLNAWLEEDVLATGILPTTSHVNRLTWGQRRSAEVSLTDGTQLDVDFAEAARLVKDESESIASLGYRYPNDHLRAVEFWDTPGFNAPDDDHETRAERALQDADAILWVMDARQALTESEFARIRSVPNRARKLIAVINKIDQFEDEDIEQIAEHVESGIGDQVMAIHLVSANEARRAQATNSREPDAFERLREAIEQRFLERTNHLKQMEVKRRLSDALADSIDTGEHVLDQLRSARRDLVDDAGTKLEGWQQRTYERPRDLTRTLGTEYREIRREFYRARDAAEGGVRILGTVIGSTPAPDAVRRLRERVQLRVKRALEAFVDALIRETRTLDEQAVGAIEAARRHLPRQEARTVVSRIDGFLAQREGRAVLLREKVVNRGLLAFEERFSLVGVRALTLIANQSEDRELCEREAARLLPVRSEEWRNSGEAWLRECMDAVSRLLAEVSRDLEILHIDVEHRIVRPLRSVYDALTPSDGLESADFDAPNDE